jgi:cytochrome P450
LSREADADSEIDGCPIPAGALVLTSPLIMHRDGRFWDDPERFDPTRWQRLDSLGESPVAYLPFGWGRRNCIGSSFAQAELALVLATVASSWRVQVQRPGRVRPRATVTLRPASAVRARLRQRSGPSPVL